MRFLTAGESHGPALVGILEGVPAGLELNFEDIQNELVRRKKGVGRGARQTIESDSFEILSGVRFGKTLGSPISFRILNKDWINWEKTMSLHSADQTLDRKVEVPRPGHADLTGKLKYNFEDMRNVLERASARETTMRVALGAIAKQFLKACGIEILSRVTEIGAIEDSTPDFQWTSDLAQKVESSGIRFAHSQFEDLAIQEIQRAQEAGDTLGGVFEVTALGCPVGLGSYVHWDHKLDGKIAQSFMSLNAIKGVEIGLGFESARRPGSQVHDEIIVNQEQVAYRSNQAGGLAAGMTTGQPLVVRAAMKPLSTLKKPLASVHLETKTPTQAHFERSDVCAVPSAAVIGESLLALVLMEEILKKFGGDSMQELVPRLRLWNEQCHENFNI